MTLKDWLRKSRPLHKAIRHVAPMLLTILTASTVTAQKTDTLRTYPDSIVYSYSDPRPRESHHHMSWPRHFSLHLPTQPRSRYNFGKDSFGFICDKDQILYIYIDYLAPNLPNSTRRITDRTDIEELLLDKLNMINNPEKIDIDNHPFDTQRETWILQQGGATILLYNILPANRTTFLEAAQTFTFTP